MDLNPLGLGRGEINHLYNNLYHQFLLKIHSFNSIFRVVEYFEVNYSFFFFTDLTSHLNEGLKYLAQQLCSST